MNKLAESKTPNPSCSCSSKKKKKKEKISPRHFSRKGRGWLAIICLAILATRQLHQLHSHTFRKALSYFTFPEYNSTSLLTLPLLWTLQTISHRCYVKSMLHLTRSCWPQARVLFSLGLRKPVPAAGFASLINPKPGSSQFWQLTSIWASGKWRCRDVHCQTLACLC